MFCVSINLRDFDWGMTFVRVIVILLLLIFRRTDIRWLRSHRCRTARLWPRRRWFDIQWWVSARGYLRCEVTTVVWRCPSVRRRPFLSIWRFTTHVRSFGCCSMRKRFHELSSSSARHTFFHVPLKMGAARTSKSRVVDENAVIYRWSTLYRSLFPSFLRNKYIT